MIPILTALFILFIHWISDFHLQTPDMSMNKSKSNYWLTMHVFVYTSTTLVWWILCLFPHPLDISTVFNFMLFIFSTHWVTDYITSRMTSKRYAEGKFHDFFVVIGFDQLLHTAQLFAAYYLFIQ